MEFNGLASPIPRVCPTGIPEFLRTDLPFATKLCVPGKRKSPSKRQAMDCGNDSERGHQGVVEGSVVEWDDSEDGSNVRPGPNASKYE
jgi:hypothetical protein